MKAMLLLLLLVAPVGASGVNDLHLDFQGGRLRVAFQVEDSLKGVEESLKAGVPLLYDFSLTVYRKKAVLPDPKVLKLRIRRRLQYDNLKGVFVLLQEGAEPLTFHTLREARASMGKLDLDLGRADRFPEGRYHLKLEVKIALKRPLLWPLAVLRALLGGGGETVSRRCEFSLLRPIVAESP